MSENNLFQSLINRLLNVKVVAYSAVGAVCIAAVWTFWNTFEEALDRVFDVRRSANGEMIEVVSLEYNGILVQNPAGIGTSLQLESAMVDSDQEHEPLDTAMRSYPELNWSDLARFEVTTLSELERSDFYRIDGSEELILQSEILESGLRPWEIEDLSSFESWRTFEPVATPVSVPMNIILRNNSSDPMVFSGVELASYVPVWTEQAQQFDERQRISPHIVADFSAFFVSDWPNSFDPTIPDRVFDSIGRELVLRSDRYNVWVGEYLFTASNSATLDRYIIHPNQLLTWDFELQLNPYPHDHLIGMRFRIDGAFQPGPLFWVEVQRDRETP